MKPMIKKHVLIQDLKNLAKQISMVREHQPNAVEDAIPHASQIRNMAIQYLTDPQYAILDKWAVFLYILPEWIDFSEISLKKEFCLAYLMLCRRCEDTYSFVAEVNTYLFRMMCVQLHMNADPSQDLRNALFGVRAPALPLISKDEKVESRELFLFMTILIDKIAANMRLLADKQLMESNTIRHSQHKQFVEFLQ